MPELPDLRPPPTSTISVKRGAVEALTERPLGWFEAELLPTLFADRLIVADDRIVVDHYQDHGAGWSVRNGFHSARASYGRARDDLSWRERLRVARWTLDGIARRVRRQARAATTEAPMGHLESGLVTAIGVANGLGGTVGTLAGPGRSADRVA
jgi:hypothetical protein